MAPKKTSLLRRRRYFRRYKTPSSTNYFRYKVDILLNLSKISNDIIYGWSGSATNILDISTQLSLNANFTQFCKQYSYVRVKAISYLANPDTRNQSLSSSGYVALTVWPRGFINSFGTWEKCVDNPFFKILNVNYNTYKYCNLLGGDNNWVSTGSDKFTSASLFVVTNYPGDVTTANAPQWLVKLSIYCIFKTPVQ